MGLEEKLPSGVLLTTVEGVAGYMRKASFWPATFGLACCAIEMMTTGGPKYDLARYGMEVFRNIPSDVPLIVVEAVWQYSHHLLHGFEHDAGP